MHRCFGLLCAIFSCPWSFSVADDLSPELLASWVAMDAPSGHEYLATERLQQGLSGWIADNSGNLKKTLGEGSEHTVVACLLDAPSFTVSQITEDGYLRLHHVGRAPGHPLWTQAHEGQQLRILTAQGPVVGVTALANGHFMNLHRDEKAFTRAQDLWLDVGASSPDDVAQLGIALLDPVIRQLPAWSLGEWVAGPAAGARVGCAVLVAAAEAGVTGAGRTTYVMTTRASFSGLGLAAALSELERPSRLIVMGRGLEVDAPLELESILGSDRTRMIDVRDQRLLAPTVIDAGALMERVSVNEVRMLAQTLLRAIGISDAAIDWQFAPERLPVVNTVTIGESGGPEEARTDVLALMLAELGELPAVSGHEGPVRQFVYDALPAWAREASETDAMGNLWVAMGPPDTPATVFIAHMDEVGWEVSAIAGDGTVDLQRMGGALALAREGQPAVLQLSQATGIKSGATPREIRGVFLNRQNPEHRQPEQLQAWFGHDAEALAALGVQVGMLVIGHKESHRLGRHRFTVRSMDDRVGTTALLQALQRLNPRQLTQRVIFVWSVQEETGLLGAAALAKRFATRTRRVYSIDTFVSSDTPLEAPHFAYARLGEGPVLRSMESSGMVSRAELARNQAVSADAGIDVQIGMTQGGTDGTAFTLYGVPNAGLSWPGRYSHGPAELGDLRDMLALVDLIVAFAKAPVKMP